MKLGQLLIQRRIIDRDQLRAALRRQDATGRPLGETLVQMGVVARADIVAALLRQPHASIDRHTLRRVPDTTRHRLEDDVQRRWLATPVALADDLLVVAMADPTDRRAIEALERSSGLPVMAVAADPDTIRDRVGASGSSA